MIRMLYYHVSVHVDIQRLDNSKLRTGMCTSGIVLSIMFNWINRTVLPPHRPKLNSRRVCVIKLNIHLLENQCSSALFFPLCCEPSSNVVLASFTCGGFHTPSFKGLWFASVITAGDLRAPRWIVNAGYISAAIICFVYRASSGKGITAVLLVKRC